MNASRLPGDPVAGSHRYFALLYTPPALRQQLNTLVALSDEIGTDPGPGADHSVAHVRLEWWRREAQRFARGQPEHPWLRSLVCAYPHSTQLNLQSLVEAAAIDLATRTQQAQDTGALPSALFALLADALCGHTLSPELQQAVGVLGAAARRLEQGIQAAHAQLRTSLQAIGSSLQPQLTPLLVWLALAARGPHQRRPLVDGIADNIAAWKAARSATRGTFKLH